MNSKELFKAHQLLVIGLVFQTMPDEENQKAEFLKLAMKTFDALKASGLRDEQIFTFYVSPDSAFNFVNREGQHHLVSPEIVNKWKDWEISYQLLLNRNPKLELYDMLVVISESMEGSSWPWGRELDILELVKKGKTGDYRDQLREYRVDGQFFDRLCEVYKKAGCWLEKKLTAPKLHLNLFKLPNETSA